METATNSLSALDARRIALGMTVDAVARRSGVSPSTVERVLSGRYASASFGTVQQIAAVLGAEIQIVATADIATLRREQARSKAQRLVDGQSNATPADSADEALAPDQVEETMYRLLAGSNRKLWADD